MTRRRRRLSAMVVASLVAATMAIGGTADALAPTPVFAPYLNYDVGYARGVAVGDFTGDGRNDVVVSSEVTPKGSTPAEDRVYLFAQGADGWLNRVDVLATELGWQPTGGMAAGDLDGDGLTDAVVVAERSLDVFLQRAGGLADAMPIALENMDLVQAVDVDDDGRVDLVASGMPGLVVVRSLGGGNFAAPVVVSSRGQGEVQVADVTGDGRRDLVACSRSILVFAQLAGGAFAPPTEHTGDVSCESVALADANGDGRTDVSFVGGGNRPGSRLDVLVQKSDGTLAATPATYATGDIPGSVKAGDMNADTRADLVVLHESWQSVGVHAQAPDHTLDPERLTRIPYANGGSPNALAVGDINGDRRPDIVIADDQHGLVVLWGQPPAPSTTTSTWRLPTTTPTMPPPGSPAPEFSAPQSYDVGAAGESLAAGDFNGDGRTDVAMSSRYKFNPDTNYKLFVFYQGADGSLQRAVSFDTEGGVGYGDVMALAAGDLDGDGRDDLVLRMREGMNVFMQRNGTFADRTYRDLPYAGRVDIADVDRDGKGDLVMTGDGIMVYRSLGGGTFESPVRVDDELGVSESAVGDVTGDGRPDIVRVDSFRAGYVVVHRQLAGGGFAPAVRIEAGGTGGTLALADFNGDSRIDVAVSHNLGGSMNIAEIRVLLQGPDGTLARAADITADDVGPLRAGDVDGDGRTDLVGLSGGSQVHVMLQKDGELGVARTYPMPYATRYPSTGMVLADFTGDGRPDVGAANYNHGLDVARNVTSTSTVPSTAGLFHALRPQRILDTRTGLRAPAGRVGPGGTIGLQVAGAGGVPTSGVSAVVLNVTVTEPTASSWLTAWPSGTARPVASNLNFGPGQTVPNLVVVKVGAGGRVDLSNHAGATHVIADVAGWFGTGTTTPGAAYTSLTPARILDTRTGVGAPVAKVGSAATLGLQVTGQGGVPASGVSAVVLNVTVTEPTATSYLTAWPAGEVRPVASNLNYGAGQTVPNLVVVKVGAGGRVDLFNNFGTTHLIADVAGWYGAETTGHTGAFNAVPPARILDTRAALGAPAAKLGPAATLGLQVTGGGGVPAAGVTAVVLNVTVTEPSAFSYLTAWPSGQPRPLASNLNFVPGQTVPNLVVVKVGAGGRVDLFNHAGGTHVVADVAGWYG